MLPFFFCVSPHLFGYFYCGSNKPKGDRVTGGNTHSVSSEMTRSGLKCVKMRDWILSKHGYGQLPGRRSADTRSGALVQSLLLQSGFSTLLLLVVGKLRQQQCSTLLLEQQLLYGSQLEQQQSSSLALYQLLVASRVVAVGVNSSFFVFPPPPKPKHGILSLCVTCVEQCSSLIEERTASR